MTTTIELIAQMETDAKALIEILHANSMAKRFKTAAQRLRELDAQVTDLELNLLTERGAKAWKDVPDATDFVEELRGNTDKPDCVWVKLPCGRDASGNDINSYDPSCIVVYTDDPLPMKLSKFCHLCGGAVKESK